MIQTCMVTCEDPGLKNDSEIRDTDMAKEMIRLANANILAQAGEAMLAQANQSTNGVLSLLK